MPNLSDIKNSFYNTIIFYDRIRSPILRKTLALPLMGITFLSNLTRQSISLLRDLIPFCILVLDAVIGLPINLCFKGIILLTKRIHKLFQPNLDESIYANSELVTYNQNRIDELVKKINFPKNDIAVTILNNIYQKISQILHFACVDVASSVINLCAFTIIQLLDYIIDLYRATATGVGYINDQIKSRQTNNSQPQQPPSSSAAAATNSVATNSAAAAAAANSDIELTSQTGGKNSKTATSVGYSNDQIKSRQTNNSQPQQSLFSSAAATNSAAAANSDIELTSQTGGKNSK